MKYLNIMILTDKLKKSLFAAVLLITATATAKLENKNFTLKKYYVIGCNVYDKNFKTIKYFSGGMCFFFEDGSFVMQTDEQTITKFSAEGDLLWEQKIFSHHQINISFDKKRLLVLSAEAVKEATCTAWYDVFYIMDVKTGNILVKKSSKNYYGEYPDLFGENYLSKMAENNFLHTDCSASHFNSIYEIPPNSAEKSNEAFKSGNILLNNILAKTSFIVDKNMQKILWTYSPIISQIHSGFHDVSFLPDGKLLYYQGIGSTTPSGERFAAFTYDPILKKNKIILAANSDSKKLKSISYSKSGGSIQVIGDGYLIGHHDVNNGGMIIFANKKGKILKTFSNPYLDVRTGKALGFLQVKEYDLARFFKNNKM